MYILICNSRYLVGRWDTLPLWHTRMSKSHICWCWTLNHFYIGLQETQILMWTKNQNNLESSLIKDSHRIHISKKLRIKQKHVNLWVDGVVARHSTGNTKKLLIGVQRLACTTPRAAIEILLGIPPLHIFIQRESSSLTQIQVQA